MTTTLDKLKQRLIENLNPNHLEVIDNSAAHAGHAGNSGGGHFTVIIDSPLFEGLTKIKMHQLVYQAVGEMMQSEIHALSIKQP